ncbi:MAG TPA: hypothetical protein VMY18_14515 [Acidobacteriota bacterium]|nr:hypothetical protein [Acidobacteriota bacterium]
MLSIDQVRDLVAVVVPVYFDPSVSEDQIYNILEPVFRGQALFCRPERSLVLVDRDTTAERVLLSSPNASFSGLPIHVLPENRAKAGAVSAGLARILENPDNRFVITRDCDGDHVAEDIPRLVSLAFEIQDQVENELVSVIGARPSLEKPMGWVREQWELLTNRILLDLVRFSLARTGAVIDERFWGGQDPDLQSGYRLYSRKAAEETVRCIEALPEDRTIWTFSCEYLPFAELMIRGGIFGQVQRLTLVEQPVTSYGSVDLAEVYGRLMVYVASNYEIPASVLLQVFDNAVGSLSLFYTDRREELLRCRRLISVDAPMLRGPQFI